MIRTLRTIPHQMDHLRSEARTILEEAMQKGFTTVIVHGFKDGKIYTTASSSHNCLEIVGALHAAEAEFWERDPGGE